MDLIPFNQLDEQMLDEDFNGQLCDLLVLNATPVDWERMVRVAAENFRVRFNVNGEEMPIPDDLYPLLHFDWSTPDTPRPGMLVYAGPLELASNFVCRDEIELDFWRRELTEEGWVELQRFMRLLGRRLSRDVLLTGEMDQSNVLVRYDVRGDLMVVEGGDPRVRGSFDAAR